MVTVHMCQLMPHFPIFVIIFDGHCAHAMYWHHLHHGAVTVCHYAVCEMLEA